MKPKGPSARNYRRRLLRAFFGRRAFFSRPRFSFFPRRLLSLLAPGFAAGLGRGSGGAALGDGYFGFRNLQFFLSGDSGFFFLLFFENLFPFLAGLLTFFILGPFREAQQELVDFLVGHDTSLQAAILKPGQRDRPADGSSAGL